MKKYYHNMIPPTPEEAEKILLLQLLMYDIRGIYDAKVSLIRTDKRVDKCVELASEFHRENVCALRAQWFKVLQALGVYLTGKYEGRYLRMSFFHDGGYEHMERVHQLPINSLKGRTTHLKRTLKKLVRVKDMEYFKN